MTREIYEGAIQIIVAKAGSGEASGAAATPGSEPCFACWTSRFDFFVSAIFVPNEISCKGNKPTARRSERLSDNSTKGPPASSAMAEGLIERRQVRSSGDTRVIVERSRRQQL
jgi:hypothetical protein